MRIEHNLEGVTAGGQNVYIAVKVDVGREDAVGAVEIVVENFVGEDTCAVVVIPRDFVCSDRGRKRIDKSIAVHVRRDDGTRSPCTAIDYFDGEVASAVIAVEHDLVVTLAGRKQVDIAIAVYIGMET
ncbi:MAG: hypothetical protein R2851_11470 [Caldilineaceae bacterium]